MRLTCSRSVFRVLSIFLTYLCYPLTYQLLLVQASDADTIIHEDHNHHRLQSLFDQSDETPSGHIRDANYEPQFLGFDRGIVGRAAEESTALANNAPQPTNIEPGDIQYWTFPKTILRDSARRPTFNLPLNLTTTNTTCLEEDLNQIAADQRRTPRTRTVWLTISTCDQPTSTTAGNTRAPPQLEVYVSRSSSNQKPDSGRNDQVISVRDGYGNITLPSVIDDIWIGVKAPPKSNGFDGIYNYELAASVDATYATYLDGNTKSNGTEITAWDFDSKSAILWTGDTTNALSNWTEFSDWMNLDPPPFRVYVHDQADPALLGLSKSVCGLRNHAKIKESDNSMIKIGGQPKQQFYVQGLNRSSTYNAIMTFEPKSSNSTVGGGGTTTPAKSSTTSPSAPTSPTPSLPTQPSPTERPTSPSPTTTGREPFTTILTNRSSRSPAKPPLRPDTPSRATAPIAKTPTEAGSAPSPSLAAVPTSPFPPLKKVKQKGQKEQRRISSRANGIPPVTPRLMR
ncbi:MAG: hypothetical protein Q9224_003215 [Gallowayella concinna]